MHEAVGEQVELAHAAGEAEVVLAAVPQAVHPRQHLVDERLGSIPHVEVLAGDIGEDLVVIGVQARGDVIAGDALAGHGGVAHPAIVPALSVADNETEFHTRARQRGRSRR